MFIVFVFIYQKQQTDLDQTGKKIYLNKKKEKKTIEGKKSILAKCVPLKELTFLFFPQTAAKMIHRCSSAERENQTSVQRTAICKRWEHKASYGWH